MLLTVAAGTGWAVTEASFLESAALCRITGAALLGPLHHNPVQMAVAVVLVAEVACLGKSVSPTPPGRQ